MNPSPVSAPPAPLPLRLFRSLLIVLLVLAFMLIAALAYGGAVFSAVETYFQDDKKPPGGVLVVVGLIVIFSPLILAIWAARKHWLKWPALASTTLVAAVVLGWLASDDPGLRHPLTIDEIAPAFEGADRSHAAILEYGNQKPTAEAKAFKTAKWKVDYVKGSPAEADKWIEFLNANRAGLEADWAAAAPQRAWLERLNTFDRLGDLTPADISAEIPSFQIWRFLSQRTCAMASLQALDGKGDEAVATLMPMLEASRKFETSSRTLVRLMIARVCQKMCYQTAGFILDRGNPGPAARASLLAAVESGNASAGAKRIVQVEYTFFAPVLEKLTFSQAMTVHGNWNRTQALPGFLNFFTRFFVNPHATANLYGDYVAELSALAEARDLGGFAAKQQAFSHTTMAGGMKNLGGRLLLNLSTPAYQKVLKSYWDIEDLRVGLRDRLQAAPATLARSE